DDAPGAARRRAARTRPVGDGRAGWSASRAALAHPGSTSGARTVPPVRASRAAHRRGAAARRPWGARDDRHLRRPRGGCRAPRRGVGRPGRDRARSVPRAMIRTVWFYAVLVVSSVIHASGVLVAALLGVKRRPGGIYDWGASDWARDIIAAAGTAVELEGRERIPPHQPVVYASNHS